MRLGWMTTEERLRTPSSTDDGDAAIHGTPRVPDPPLNRDVVPSPAHDGVAARLRLAYYARFLILALRSRSSANPPASGYRIGRSAPLSFEPARETVAGAARSPRRQNTRAV